MHRVIALVDMDCFYVQVEQRLNPALIGKPCAVVQYTRDGSIIAVSYEARAAGVNRHMRGCEAQLVCPDLELVKVPEVRGKADLTRYREAGEEVIAVLSREGRCVQRASVDEAYVDLTSEVDARLTGGRVDDNQLANTHVVGWSDGSQHAELSRAAGVESWLMTMEEDIDSADSRLAVGALLIEELRAAILEITGFKCSAGIAHNKVLAKLVCGLHKPNQQTVLPQSSLGELFQVTQIRKVPQLGGKFGRELVEQLNVQYMCELLQFSEKTLNEMYGQKAGSWLYQLCRGIETDPVNDRQLAKSVGSGKNFPGKGQLTKVTQVTYWLQQLSDDLVERLTRDQEKNKRRATQLSINMTYASEPRPLSVSKSCALVSYDAKKIALLSLSLLQKFNTATVPDWRPAVLNLSLSAGKFDSGQANTRSIRSFLQPESAQQSTSSHPPRLDIAAVKASRVRRTSISSYFDEESRQQTSDRAQGDSSACNDLRNESYDHDMSDSTSDVVTGIENSADVCFDVSNVCDSTEHRTMLSRCDGVTNSVWDRTENASSIGENDDINRMTMGSVSQETSRTWNMATCSNSDGSYDKLKGDGTVYNTQRVLGEHSSTSPSGNLYDFTSAKSVVVDSADMMTCDQCSQSIPIWEMPEHTDYHVAFDLQRSERAAGNKRITQDRPTSSKRCRTSGVHTLHKYFT